MIMQVEMFIAIIISMSGRYFILNDEVDMRYQAMTYEKTGLTLPCFVLCLNIFSEFLKIE